MKSSLDVAGNVTFKKDLTIEGNLNVLGEQTILNVTTLSTEDAKIELNTLGSDMTNVGFYTNILTHGGEIHLVYDISDKNWEFNRDLNILGNLTVLDSTTISDTLSVTNNITTPNYIIKDNNSPNTITLVAPGLDNPYTLTLPRSEGSEKQLLQTDGSGNLSWESPIVAHQIKSGTVNGNNCDYRTNDTKERHLYGFDVSINLALNHSSNEIVYRFPYEASLQANQRISFTVKKLVNGEIIGNINSDKLLGPKNATGGMRNVYSLILNDTNMLRKGNTIEYRIFSNLETEVTSKDSGGNNRIIGVDLSTDDVGIYRVAEYDISSLS